MGDSGTPRALRITAGVMGLMMLVLVLFSAFYIIAESGHDCEDEGCPICACIRQCERTIHQACAGTAVKTTVFLPVVFMILAVFFKTSICLQESLVSQKVRLNS